jgi:hypothetical protein
MTAVLRSANIAVSGHLLKVFLVGQLLFGCTGPYPTPNETSSPVEEAAPGAVVALPDPPLCTVAELYGGDPFVDEGSGWTIESTWVEGQWWQFDARIERHIQVESEAAGWRTPRVATASMVLPFDVGIRKNGRRAADEFEVRFYAPRSVSPHASLIFTDIPVPGESWICRIESSGAWDCSTEPDGITRQWPTWLFVPTALPAVDSGPTSIATDLSLVTGVPLGISMAASRTAETIWTHPGVRTEPDGARRHLLLGRFQGRTTMDVAEQRESVNSTGLASVEWNEGEILPHLVTVCWSAQGNGSASELMNRASEATWSRVETTRLDVLVRRILAPRNSAAAPVEGPPGQ